MQEFCTYLDLIDGEGDYVAQRHELHAEISAILAGSVDNAQIDSVIALVQEKSLPKNNGEIVREDILKRFGVTSERDLFPAPLEFEKSNNFIKREQHEIQLNRWINIALSIDAAARVLIDFALKQAAYNAEDEKTGAWIEKSTGISDDKYDDLSIIIRLIEEPQKGDLEEEARERTRNELSSRIKKLEMLIEFSQLLRDELTENLENASDKYSSIDA